MGNPITASALGEALTADMNNVIVEASKIDAKTNDNVLGAVLGVNKLMTGTEAKSSTAMGAFKAQTQLNKTAAQ